jgi:GntR family transcriptional regulator
VAALPDAWIDRTSPVPYHFQLSELLEQEIQERRWERGCRLPGEMTLCAHFGVSRTTVRQALSRLEQEGLVVRDKGRGCFVAESERRSWLLQSADGLFQDETERLGRSVSSRILRLERGALPGWALDSLKLPKGADGMTLERVRSVDGKVALYVVNHLPAWLEEAVLSLRDPNESLYRRLRDAGLEVSGAHRSLEAVKAGSRLAELLELVPGAPVVAIHSVAWERNGRPFDCYRAWLRTDRLTIEVSVGSTRDLVDMGGGVPPGGYAVVRLSSGNSPAPIPPDWQSRPAVRGRR